MLKRKTELVKWLPDGNVVIDSTLLANRHEHCIKATVDLPPDKSLTHRFIIFAAMASGDTVLVNPSTGHDCLATKRAMEAFGVHIEEGESHGKTIWRVRSRGIGTWRSPETAIDAENSGTTARLLIGLCSAVRGLIVELKGDESLSVRPMGRIVDPLLQGGANITTRNDTWVLPLRVEGQTLQNFSAKSDVPSAQVKSALLLAATQVQGRTIIDVPLASRDHTERIMMAMGAPLVCKIVGERGHYLFEGPWNIEPFRATIPRDPSAMAFLAVLAFINPGMKICCSGVLNNAGRAFYLKLLEGAGLTVTRTTTEHSDCPGESIADFEFLRPSTVSAFDVKAEDASWIIDEIPALAVAAAFAGGVSIFRGLGELRVKESDRLSETIRLLSLGGIKSELVGSDLKIFQAESVAGFEFYSDDHRMLMAASILATRSYGKVKLGPASAVRVSFPLFFDTLQQIYM